MCMHVHRDLHWAAHLRHLQPSAGMRPRTAQESQLPGASWSCFARRLLRLNLTGKPPACSRTIVAKLMVRQCSTSSMAALQLTSLSRARQTARSCPGTLVRTASRSGLNLLSAGPRVRVSLQAQARTEPGLSSSSVRTGVSELSDVLAPGLSAFDQPLCRLKHRPDKLLQEVTFAQDEVTGDHIVRDVLPGSRPDQAGLRTGMYLELVTCPVLSDRMHATATKLGNDIYQEVFVNDCVTLSQAHPSLIEDLSEHFDEQYQKAQHSHWAIYNYSDEYLFQFRHPKQSVPKRSSDEASSSGVMRAPMGNALPISLQQDVQSSCNMQPLPAGPPPDSYLSIQPADSLHADIQLILDSGTTFTAHAHLLRSASHMLSQALDSARIRQPGDTSPSSPLLLPTITEPQAKALLHALYCENPGDQLTWAGQQPLSSLQDLANTAHALACTALLQLADTVLAARASSTPSDSPTAGLASILLTPANAPALLSWATSLGLKSFAGQAERAVEQSLPHMPAHMLAEVYADLHPAVVGRFLADMQHKVQSSMVHAQALLEGGDAHGAKFMLSRALKAAEKLPR